ncbi:MAG: hypothetical protein QM627_02130 [Luteolibacter sp.]
MKSRVLSGLLLWAVSASSLSAQTPSGNGTDTASPQERLWSVTLAGGEYHVALSRIVSVSRHQYLLEGGLMVDEVTIDTEGQALARFYLIQPVTTASKSPAAKPLSETAGRAQDAVERAGEITGTPIRNQVIKKYPETTHAKTIEYRLDSKAQLDTLFESAKQSWRSGKGRRLTVK